MTLADAPRFPGLLGIQPLEQRLRVWTRFDDEYVELGTKDGERYEWPLIDVKATPYDTRVMELELDGSLLYFVADDPLRFADEFIDTLDRTASRPPPKETERKRRRSARTADPLDRRTTIPVFPSHAAPPLRRTVDRERLVPLGRKGKLVRPKKHTHQWAATDSSYGLTRYVCDVCRHVTIDLTGPGALSIPSSVGSFASSGEFQHAASRSNA